MQRRINSFKPSENPLVGKNMPHSIEAERALLGAILLNDEHFSLISGIVGEKDFYVPAHRIIFKVMVDLTEKRMRLDVITMQDELSKRDHLEEVGGAVYLISLQEDIRAIGLIEQHARIVREKSVLRELIISASSIISNCYQEDSALEEVVDKAEKTIFQISQKRTAQHFVQLNIWLKKTFQHLSEIKNHRGVTGVPAGYKRLDEMTSGFQKGDLIVLAARPSMGKTALALSFAEHAAREGSTVGFFSLEMGAQQLALRLLSSCSQVSHQNIRNVTITSDDWVELTHAAAQLAELKMFVDDTAMQSIMDIRTRARKLKLEHNLGFLVIDYLQLIHASQRYENRHQEVSEISRSLKALAKELEIPIVALSQLSRAVDSRVDKRPMLSDLRESGAIEQDADVIMFLYRDVVYNQETENPMLAELIIGKQRNGPTGTVFLNFQRELTLFEDME